MNNNFYNGVYSNKKSEMNSTTGRFFKAFGIFLVLVFFMLPFYFANYFMEKEFDYEVNLDDEYYENDYEDDYESDNLFDDSYDVKEGNLVVFKYDGSSFNGENIYSIAETNMAKLIDYYEIECLSGNCSFENADEYTLFFGELFFLFKDGDKMGVFDVSRKEVIARFDESLNYEDYKFIIDSNNNINMNYFFVRLGDNSYGLYDVELGDYLAKYDISSFIYSPFVVPSESITDIDTVYDNNILVISNGKYKLFDFVTGKNLFEDEYEEIKCYEYDDNYYCDLKNGKDMTVISVNSNKDKYDIVHETSNFYYKYDNTFFEKNLDYLSTYSVETGKIVDTSYKIDVLSSFRGATVDQNYALLYFSKAGLSTEKCDVYKYDSASKTIEYTANVTCKE